MNSLCRRTERGGVIENFQNNNLTGRGSFLSPSAIPSLLDLFNDGTMDSAEILETLEKMKNYNRIKEKYQDKIKHRKDGRQVYVLINRKQIAASNEDALYEKLYAMEYGCENYTMEDIFPLWLMWKRDHTPTTAKSLQIYQQKWRKYLEGTAISKIPLRNLTPKDFTALFREWTKDRSLTSRGFNDVKIIINGMYSYAINEISIVTSNPIREIDMRQFPLKPVNSKKEKAFNSDERKKLLKYLKNKEEHGIDEMYSLAIQFDFFVTLRIGELRALKWKNLKGNELYVEGQVVLSNDLLDDGTFSPGSYESVDHVKGNSDAGYRWITLTSKALEILEKVREINPDGEFIFMYKGKQLYTQTFNEHLRKYCEEVGIDPKGRGSHSIRFTVASILYLSGTPIQEIQRLLGHTTLSMTLHYLKNVQPRQTTVKIMERTL